MKLAVVLAVVLLFLVGRSSRVRAQTPEPINRAGLVVQHGDGTVLTRCVAFPEDEITGEELLRRSGLSPTVDPTMGFGAAVCKLDGEGCDYPKEKCWCQCQGSPCVYWTYAHLKADGTWQLAGIGATARRLRHGDVDGWTWGPGTPGSGVTPPPITFDEICPSETTEDEPTEVAGAGAGVEKEPPMSSEPGQENNAGESAAKSDVVNPPTPTRPAIDSIESVVVTTSQVTEAAEAATTNDFVVTTSQVTEAAEAATTDDSVVATSEVTEAASAATTNDSDSETNATPNQSSMAPTSGTVEQPLIAPTHTPPPDTPTPVRQAARAPSANAQAAAIEPTDTAPTVTPSKAYGSYAVFAVIVLSLVGWLGITRARR